MSKISMKLDCKFSKVGDKHTFTVVNSATGNCIYSPPEAWDSRSQAYAAWTRLKARAIETCIESGGDIKEETDESVTLKLRGQKVNIRVALVGDKDTRKCGVAIFGNTKVLVKPLAWFDHPKQAFKYYVSNIADYQEAIDEIIGRGVTELSAPTDLPEDMWDNIWNRATNLEDLTDENMEDINLNQSRNRKSDDDKNYRNN